MCADSRRRLRGFMGRERLQDPDVNRSHEPTPNPSGGGESMSGMLAEFPSWEGPGVGRIMGREHLQNPDVNRSHEPTPNPSGGGESMSRHACEFPSWEGPGVGRIMGREHLRSEERRVGKE